MESHREETQSLIPGEVLQVSKILDSVNAIHSINIITEKKCVNATLWLQNSRHEKPKNLTLTQPHWQFRAWPKAD